MTTADLLKINLFVFVSADTSSIPSTFEYFDIGLSFGISCLLTNCFNLQLYLLHIHVQPTEHKTKATNPKVFFYFLLYYFDVLETSVKQCKLAKMQANE